MKFRIHRNLSERIREGCEGRLNVRINPRWFAIGNVFPDCSHQRILRMHEMHSAGKMVGRMIQRFCSKSIYSGQNLSRWRSLRLGIVMHYVCDFSCYVHTSGFDGTLREHRAYEQLQGALSDAPQKRDFCTFFETEDSAEVFRLFEQALQQRKGDSFSPAGDLDYALSVGTELAYAMLRICMGETAHMPLRYRIPYFRRRLLRAMSY